MLSIGSFVGCLLAGVCMERWGRRFSLMVITSLSYLIGFICILLADSAAIIFLGRSEMCWRIITDLSMS